MSRQRSRSFSSYLAAALVALASGLGSCSSTPAAPPVVFAAEERNLLLTLSPLPAPPRDATNAVDGLPTAIALGAALFFDPRLSGSGRFSCSSCHDPAKAWTDGRSLPLAEGTGLRNTLTLWNAAHQRWLLWDGGADSLWSQALRPIEDPLEMNATRLQVARTVAEDASLSALYRNVFGAAPALGAGPWPASAGPRALDPAAQLAWWQLDPADRERVNRIFANVGKSLASFVGTIVTKPAPFDRFVEELRAGHSSSNALTPAQQRGLKLFIGRGNCVLCHSGPHFSNLEFHDIRVPPLNTAMRPDLGRSEGIAKLSGDEFVSAGYFSDDPLGTRAQHLAYLDGEAGVRGHFRTPSLRNVALTAPYMHQGQIATLREVVEHYSTLANAVEPADPNHVEALIVPLALSEREVDDLVAFLHSLTSDP